MSTHGWRMRLGVAGAAVVVGLASASAPASATVTFGADLAAQANVSFQCSVPPPFFGPYRPPSPFAPPDTCTALTVAGFGGSTQGSLLVPEGSGVITKIRVHMPPRNFDSAASGPNSFGPWRPLGQTGPLRVTVLRALRQGASSLAICCTVTSESAPFVPAQQDAAGTVSEFTLNPPLPVHAITTVTGVYEFEGIALTAVDATSIIPAGSSGTASSGAYFPAARPGQERFEQQASLGSADGINQGTQILLQADWEPDPVTPDPVTPTPPAQQPAATPIGATPAPAAPPAVAARLNRTTATVGAARRSASFPVLCALTTACDVRLALRRRAAGARAAATSKKAINYGTGTARIAAGKQKTVTVKLTSAGRALLRTRRSIKVSAVLTVGKQTTTRTVTLRRAG